MTCFRVGATETGEVMKIGVLALQGAFREHVAMLHRCGTETREVRLPEELQDIDGLVIPGGESTTMTKLVDRYGFREPLLDLARRGAPLFGTCAGAILLAQHRSGQGSGPLNLIDIQVTRNGYGRQIDSREAPIILSFSHGEPFHALFIRAPVIDTAAANVTVLARYEDNPVLARQHNILAATFHPELTRDERIHRYFLGMCRSQDRN